MRLPGEEFVQESGRTLRRNSQKTKRRRLASFLQYSNGGADGARTRDLQRDSLEVEEKEKA